MPSDEIDVSCLQPASRTIVHRAAEICLAHLRPALISLVAHGSAMKGGYVPGCSDVDLSLIVQPASLSVQGQLPLAMAGSLYRALSVLDTTPFSYLQLYVYPPGTHAFMPGAYHVVWGVSDVPLASADDLRRDANAALASLDPQAHAARISRQLLAHSDNALFRELRLLCTDVWPTLYHLLCLTDTDPLEVWRLTKEETMARTGATSAVGQTIRAFHAARTAHYTMDARDTTALAAIERGLAFLEAAAWYAAEGSVSPIDA